MSPQNPGDRSNDREFVTPDEIEEAGMPTVHNEIGTHQWRTHRERMVQRELQEQLEEQQAREEYARQRQAQREARQQQRRSEHRHSHGSREPRAQYYSHHESRHHESRHSYHGMNSDHRHGSHHNMDRAYSHGDPRASAGYGAASMPNMPRMVPVAPVDSLGRRIGPIRMIPVPPSQNPYGEGIYPIMVDEDDSSDGVSYGSSDSSEFPCYLPSSLPSYYRRPYGY